MATSNRERVGNGFELLAEGLGPFVDEVMTAATPNGQDWVKVLEARDAQKFGTNRTYSKSDPAVQLKVITEEWRAGFKDRLSRGEQSIASLLRDHRNKWAHNERYNPDDASHVLDLIERLLTAVGDTHRAAAVRKEKKNLLRAMHDAETREAVRESVRTAVGVPGMVGRGQTIKPWREVIRPHRDVAAGRYASAEFAADLDGVSRNEGGEEYVHPVRFFERTYLTAGLRNLLSLAARRLSGDASADPVINLQTNFGGGKTHSMLALYHLASGTPLAEFPQDLYDVIAETEVVWDGIGEIKRVTLVGNRISAADGETKDDGTHVNTLWGELAWQLGGREAYEKVAAADEAGTNPGRALQELIAVHSPCLILIDEWVAYARELYAKDNLPAGTFDSQFTFAQTLTEAVKAVPGALLVVSIPASDKADGSDDDATGASDLEIGGLHGKAALKRLQNVVRRVAYPWQPATAQESFEIVRRRLFEETDADGRAEIGAVARQFIEFYRSKHGEFPRECSESAYEDRIKAAYPIHPELFDRLYKDWSTLERFQRTRGVLRMMSTVVHALWEANDPSPLIMPGSIPLQDPRVVSELNQYLDDEWKVIISTDVDGEGSIPVRIDEERTTFGQRRLTRRLARTVFFGSAPTLNSDHKGIDRQYVWLGVAIPGDTIGNFGSALDLLSQRTTFFYPENGRYYYSTQASIARYVQDRAEALRGRPEEVWAEIAERLRRDQMKSTGHFARVHPAPEGTDGVPDYEEARLVLLHPRFFHSKSQKETKALDFVAKCLKQRGSSQRINVNQLAFLAPDERRLLELEDAVRDYLAWKEAYAGRGETGLNLTAQQASLAETRCAQADVTVNLRISGTYTWLIVPEQLRGDREYELRPLRCEGSEDRLAVRASKVLVDAGLFTVEFGTRNLRRDLDTHLRSVWETGEVSLGALWGYYRKHPYLMRLRDRSVLEQAMLAVLSDGITWEAEGFALAEGHDETSGAYVGLALPMQNSFGPLTDATLLVRPERANEQRQRELAAAAQAEAARQEAEARAASAGPLASPTVDRPTGDGGRLSADTTTPALSEATAPEPVRNVRFFGSYPVDAERSGRDFAKFVDEILPHLRSASGAEVKIRLEVEARCQDGYPNDKVRTVTENARTLKFDQYGFEDE
ncbi:Swt1 family HEPN domain-containing protein [Streptomyces triticirhizae]|uniref:ATP-binding protein n=1 Tax=Streptomyces triticirhizae TaxID=2483353 RepID=A0A3M2M730_9ACTN|nr:Swt1 family HEPN domain-containing protein [Streptomyces triticirhizae]RMI45396.1 ATP-binding protein [Streptomyces triticirhizae]